MGNCSGLCGNGGTEQTIVNKQTPEVDNKENEEIEEGLKEENQKEEEEQS